MEKIGIIGAGISGLTVASLLNKTREVVVFEKEEGPGGLIRCKKLPEGLFHICGGHVFNTKVEEVQNWFWHHFDKENDFVKARRNSVVFTSEGLVIPYPVENHFFLFDKSIQNKIIQDLLFISAHPKEPSNFGYKFDIENLNGDNCQNINTKINKKEDDREENGIPGVGKYNIRSSLKVPVTKFGTEKKGLYFDNIISPGPAKYNLREKEFGKTNT